MSAIADAQAVMQEMVEAQGICESPALSGFLLPASEWLRIVASRMQSPIPTLHAHIARIDHEKAH